MVALFLCGLLIPVASACLLTAAFFAQAWALRREDREFLLFALLNVALSAHVAAIAAVYWSLGGMSSTLWARRSLDGAILASAVAVPLLFHFALRYARVRHERILARVGYGLAALFAAALLLHRFWSGWPLLVEPRQVFGLVLPLIRLQTGAVGAGFFLFALGGVGVVTALFAGAYVRGRREGTLALIGVVLTLLATVNDAVGIGMSFYATAVTVPVGYAVFAYGMSLTLVSRYGRVSQELEKRTEQLRRRSDELASSLVELRQAQAEVVHREQLAVVGELAAVITHEVRNPLSRVSAAVESLSHHDRVTEDTGSLLVVIEEEMGRLERLITHLLNYARPVVPQRAAMDVGQLIDTCLESIRELDGVEIDVRIAADVPVLRLDVDFMRQALEAIIDNAAQAMAGQGDLAVEVEATSHHGVACVSIDFHDTGEGMSEEEVQLAYVPFYTTRQAGVGLGLAICHRIIEAHGGVLDIRSTVGTGTTVTVILPIDIDERLGLSEAPAAT